MKFIISIAQIIVSVLLVITVLLQQRGGGLSSAFGGQGEFYSTRRGAEKWIFYSTIALAAIFIGLALVSLALAK